jgi:ABC-type nickel/cobalt efflux system permease component RcnA
MIYMLIAATLSGLAMGFVHVLSGPDHLAAVAPLSVGKRGAGWQIGFRWGIGHAAGVLLVGLLSLWLRELLPLNSLSFVAERIVGITLIGIGFWGLRNACRHHWHAHEHTHDGQTHAHIHVHGLGTAHAPGEAKPHRHTHTALLIGTLHGFAGSSHLLGVLPALAFPNGAQAGGYLAGFGLGTVAGMMSFSSLVGWLATGRMLRGGYAYGVLMALFSLASVGVGGYWLFA